MISPEIRTSAQLGLASRNWVIEAGEKAAEADKIDPAQITEFVGKAREAAPYLFVTPVASGNGAALNGASQAKIRAPLTVAESSSRGARDTASSTMSISKSMMGTPGWMTKNKAEAAAFKSGDYTVTDD